MKLKTLTVLALATISLIACRKDEENTTNNNNGGNGTTWVDNNSSSLSSRITYINEEITFTGKRSSGNSYLPESHPASTPPTNCSTGCTNSITGNQGGWLNVNNGQYVCITSTANFNGGINMNGGTLSICGTVSLSGLNINNGATVIVNDGANFSVSGHLNVNNGGSFVNYSDITLGGLNNNNNLENYGSMVISGNFHNNSQGSFVNNCGVTVGGNFHQNGQLDLFGYMDVAGEVFFNTANGTNNLNAGSLIECNDLTINDEIYALGSSYSAISVADYTKINSQGDLFGNLDLCDANGIEINNGSAEPSVTFCSAFIPASGNCNPGFGSSPSPTWTLVADVAAPTEPGGHKLSATCIQIIDNYAYVSWHWNGAPSDYAGLLEVYNISNPTTPVIVSTLWSTDIDFNHLFVEDSEFAPAQRRLWSVGSRNLNTSGLGTPAWMGEFTLTNYIFTMNTFEETDLPSYSGNTVIKYNNSLLLTSAKSNGALTNFDLATDSLTTLIQDERMRHLDIDGNNMIALQQDDNNSVMYVFSLPNPNFNNLASINVGPIAPDDGKNVARLDGNKAYVATGRDGLKVFDINTMSSTPVGTFDVTSGLTNGVSTDNDYVYVANGASGVYILNKADLSVVGNYKYDGSANYVDSKNNFVFVANGTGGLKIIRRD